MMLTITLDLSPEKEQELTEKIERRDAEGVRQVLIDSLDSLVAQLMQKPRPLTKEEFWQMADELAQIVEQARPDDAPPLSDEALTRESIYAGRPKI